MVTAKTCHIGYINSSKLEAEVISKLGYFKNDECVIDTLIKEILQSNQNSIDEAPLNNLKRELSKASEELARWYDAYGKGNLDFSEVNSRIEMASKKKKNIEEQISSILQLNDEAKANPIETSKLKPIIQDLSCIWENAAHLERKIILKGFIKSVIVYKDRPPLIEFRIK